MSVEKLYRLKERLCAELEEISDRTNQLSETDVHQIKMLTASIHYLDKICESENDGYSGARGRGRYAARDSMGRYSSDGNYSGRMYPHMGGYGYSFDSGHDGEESVDARLEQIEHMLKSLQASR